jgi:hypothetical protein
MLYLLFYCLTSFVILIEKELKLTSSHVLGCLLVVSGIWIRTHNCQMKQKDHKAHTGGFWVLDIELCTGGSGVCIIFCSAWMSSFHLFSHLVFPSSKFEVFPS